MAKTCAGVDTNILECTGGGTAGIWAVLAGIINILSLLVGIAAVIGITIFGIQILTTKGDPGRVAKAKNRLFQIVIGLAAYIFLWAGSQWLLPGGLFSTPDDINSVSLEFVTNNILIGDTVSPKVVFSPETPIDSSYNLTTKDNSIITIKSNTIQCLKAGKATVVVTTVNNKQSSAEITCVNKVKPKNDYGEDDDAFEDYDDGGGGGSGGGEMPDGDYYTPEQIAQFNQEWNSLGDITYDEVVQLAKNKGISEGNIAGILAWAHYESYELANDYGPYFAYLCNSVGVNSALSYEQRGNGRGWLDQIAGWGGGYTSAEYVGTHPNTGNYGSGYLPSNLKSAYIALKHTYPNIYGCSGDIPHGGGYVPGVNTPVYDPTGYNGTGGYSLIFDGSAP